MGYLGIILNGFGTCFVISFPTRTAMWGNTSFSDTPLGSRKGGWGMQWSILRHTSWEILGMSIDFRVFFRE